MNFDIPHIINYFHMKKNVLSNILFFFFIFLVSCAGEKQVVNNVYPILDLDQAIPVDSIKFSDIFDSAKIITFDKSSQALKMCIRDSFYWLYRNGRFRPKSNYTSASFKELILHSDFSSGYL